jgi:3-hydroxyisobutyrate dehydrogenase-like beta-hydroxyacid dehydrogenase
VTGTIAVLGLGEAGGAIARGLVRAGAVVRGFDPRATAPEGVIAATDDADACCGAGIVLSVNSAADARDALAQGLPGCAPGTVWADLNTASPGLKADLQRLADGRVEVLDVAIMAPVAPRGLATPMTVSGTAAVDFAVALRSFGAVVDVIDGPVGAAATHKLLRSVFYKGLAAAVVEALAAARAAGLDEWLRGNITEELVRADASIVERLVTGSVTHAVRRTHEMEAAAELLDDLGVPARVTRASRDWLADLAWPATPPPED